MENKSEYSEHLSFDELLAQNTREGWNYVGMESLEKKEDIEDLKIKYSQYGKNEVNVVLYYEGNYLIFTKIKQ